MVKDQRNQEKRNNMWLKFVPSEKGKRIIELGKKRVPGDPVYDTFNDLNVAINNLKNSIIDSIPNCITNKLKGI